MFSTAAAVVSMDPKEKKKEFPTMLKVIIDPDVEVRSHTSELKRIRLRTLEETGISDELEVVYVVNEASRRVRRFFFYFLQ